MHHPTPPHCQARLSPGPWEWSWGCTGRWQTTRSDCLDRRTSGRFPPGLVRHCWQSIGINRRPPDAQPRTGAKRRSREPGMVHQPCLIKSPAGSSSTSIDLVLTYRWPASIAGVFSWRASPHHAAAPPASASPWIKPRRDHFPQQAPIAVPRRWPESRSTWVSWFVLAGRCNAGRSHWISVHRCTQLMGDPIDKIPLALEEIARRSASRRRRGRSFEAPSGWGCSCNRWRPRPSALIAATAVALSRCRGPQPPHPSPAAAGHWVSRAVINRPMAKSQQLGESAPAPPRPSPGRGPFLGKKNPPPPFFPRKGKQKKKNGQKGARGEKKPGPLLPAAPGWHRSTGKMRHPPEGDRRAHRLAGPGGWRCSSKGPRVSAAPGGTFQPHRDARGGSNRADSAVAIFRESRIFSSGFSEFFLKAHNNPSAVGVVAAQSGRAGLFGK